MVQRCAGFHDRGVKKNGSAKVFGEELRRLREFADISQEELSFRADIHRNYVSLLERGLRVPSLDILLKLGKALDMPASLIVGKVEARLR